jgi:hypothetical protein
MVMPLLAAALLFLAGLPGPQNGSGTIEGDVGSRNGVRPSSVRLRFFENEVSPIETERGSQSRRDAI